jgi:hypothetical protein
VASDPPESEELGFAARADAPVDEAKVARIMAAVALVAALLCVVGAFVAGLAEPSPRRVQTPILALVLAVPLLGPVKRAFAFDRGSAAIVAGAVVGTLGLGGGLSLAGMAASDLFAVWVALGALGATVLLALGRALGTDAPVRRRRRSAAMLGWVALNGAHIAFAGSGYALVPTDAVPLWPALAGGALLVAAGQLARRHT